jgi:hypothetical protein
MKTFSFVLLGAVAMHTDNLILAGSITLILLIWIKREARK